MFGIAGIMLFQIGSNHQESMLIIEKCFENFEKEGVVVIEKKNFWSPASCDKRIVVAYFSYPYPYLLSVAEEREEILILL